ncbi:MAG: hypothetical protein IJX80_07610 [Clostridia bacterium]|nr:hypothetical protein [Clostridia bacterium]
MVGILLTVVVLVYLLASVAWSVFLRRFRKTRVRFFGVLASFILSVVGALIAKAVLSGSGFAEGTLIPLIESNVSKEMAQLLADSPALLETIVGCAIALIVPLVMLILFIVLNFFAWIVYLLISLLRGAAMKEKDQEEDQPVYVLPLTIGLAVVQSLLVVIAWMVPIATYAGIAPVVMNEISAAQVLDENTQKTIDDVNREYIESIDNSPVLIVFRTLGADPLSDAMTNFSVKGVNVNLKSEVRSVASLASNVMRLGVNEIANYGEAESAAFENITESFQRSKLLPLIVSEVVHNATGAWKNGEAFIGVEADTLYFDESGMFDDFTDTLIDVLYTDTADGKTGAICDDIDTVGELVRILIDKEVLASVEDQDAMISKLSGDGVINDMILALGKNDSMKILIPEVTNIGVYAIASTLGIKENDAAIYNELMDSLAEQLNEAGNADDRVAAVSDALKAEFDDAGIVVEKTVISFYAEAMVTDLLETSGGRTIDSDDVSAFFAVYAWNAAEQSTSVSSHTDSTHALAGTNAITEASLKELLRGTVYADKSIAQLKNSAAAELAVYTLQNASAYPSAISSTKGLYSAETMNTVLVTLEDLTLDTKTAAEKITDLTVGAEAEAISSIFKAAKDVLDQTADSSELELESVSESIGSILDALVASPTYGTQKTADLFTAILQSETVRDAAKMDIKTATDLARKGSDGDTVDYKATFHTVSVTVSVMDSMNKNSGKLEDAEIVKLIESVNPQTAGMIEVYITPERMEEDYSMSKEHSGTAAPLISNTFGYLADNDVEDYDKEAKAINQVMSITMAARDSANDPEHNKSLLGNDGVLADQGETEEERAANVVEAFMASEAVAHSLATTPYEEDPFELSGLMENNESADEVQTMKDAMSDYYNEPGNRTEENKEKLTNMANLFGLSDIDDVFA